MYVDLHQRSIDNRTNTESSNERRVPEEARDVHYAMRELICAVDHQRVSEGTMSQNVEEVIGMELDYKIGIPCVVQWCMVWLSAPTRLNRTLERRDQKIVKYHEVVNVAITARIQS